MKDWKNSNWNLDGCDTNINSCSLAVLMDIRSELKALNSMLRCPNFQNIPRKLDRISKNTHKIRRKRKTTMPNPGGKNGDK